jgi:hypothetical protein
LLLVSSNHLPCLDLAIMLFLNKDMRFKDILLLSLGQLMPMHGLVQVVPMELLHFDGDCLLCSLAPFLQGCLHGHLCHDHANDIWASVQTLPHQLHQSLRHAQGVLALLPCNGDISWVNAMAYLLPFILGTYFSGAFLAQEFVLPSSS